VTGAAVTVGVDVASRPGGDGGLLGPVGWR